MEEQKKSLSAIKKQLVCVQDDIYLQTDKEDISVAQLIELVLDAVDCLGQEFSEQVEQLIPSMQRASEGIQEKDWVYTMDVVQYEILPYLEEVLKQTSEGSLV